MSTIALEEYHRDLQAIGLRFIGPVKFKSMIVGFEDGDEMRPVWGKIPYVLDHIDGVLVERRLDVLPVLEHAVEEALA